MHTLRYMLKAGKNKLKAALRQAGFDVRRYKPLLTLRVIHLLSDSMGYQQFIGLVSRLPIALFEFGLTGFARLLMPVGPGQHNGEYPLLNLQMFSLGLQGFFLANTMCLLILFR